MSNVFNYGTQGILIGGNSPYFADFESIAATPINGVQSSQVTLTYPREDTVDWAGGGDPILTVRPLSTLQFSYVFSNGVNEGLLGFALNNFGIPALANMNFERNYYLYINQGNYDLIGYSGFNNFVAAFGNGLITKYDFTARVGQPSVCDITVECLNMVMQGTGSGNPLPSVNYQSGTQSTGTYVFPAFSQSVTNYFEAAPSNIQLVFDTGSAIGAVLSGNVSCLLQSFSFTVDMPRLSAKNLGWVYPNSRPIHWPISISMHADAYLNGLQVDALNRFGCPDSGMNFTVSFTSGNGLPDPFEFQFIGAKLQNEVITAQITDYDKVSLDWVVKIYDINRTSGNAGNFFTIFPQKAWGSIIFLNVNWGTGFNQIPLVVNLSQSGYLSILSGPAVLVGNVVAMINEGPQTVLIKVSVSGSAETEIITCNIQ